MDLLGLYAERVIGNFSGYRRWVWSNDLEELMRVYPCFVLCCYRQYSISYLGFSGVPFIKSSLLIHNLWILSYSIRDFTNLTLLRYCNFTIHAMIIDST